MYNIIYREVNQQHISMMLFNNQHYTWNIHAKTDKN